MRTRKVTRAELVLFGFIWYIGAALVMLLLFGALQGAPVEDARFYLLGAGLFGAFLGAIEPRPTIAVLPPRL